MPIQSSQEPQKANVNPNSLAGCGAYATLREDDFTRGAYHLKSYSYVDLYAGNVQGVRDKIPYFKELGLTYLHLMPLFKTPEKDSDGGYAVSSYRDIDARVGTMQDLRLLAKELHEWVFP